MKTIFGDPIRHPDQPVQAWVGTLASDFLGDYDTPYDAVRAARTGGYSVVHVMYDAEADAIDTCVGWTVNDAGVIDGVQYVTVLDNGNNPVEYNLTAEEANDRYALNLNDNRHRRVGS